jgi:hypothetical protein
MKGIIKFKGWSYAGSIKLRPGLLSERYRNDEGWIAEEVFSGARNKLIGLLVRDESGEALGMVKTVRDLP